MADLNPSQDPSSVVIDRTPLKSVKFLLTLFEEKAASNKRFVKQDTANSIGDYNILDVSDLTKFASKFGKTEYFINKTKQLKVETIAPKTKNKKTNISSSYGSSSDDLSSSSSCLSISDKEFDSLIDMEKDIVIKEMMIRSREEKKAVRLQRKKRRQERRAKYLARKENLNQKKESLDKKVGEESLSIISDSSDSSKYEEDLKDLERELIEKKDKNERKKEEKLNDKRLAKMKELEKLVEELAKLDISSSESEFSIDDDIKKTKEEIEAKRLRREERRKLKKEKKIKKLLKLEKLKKQLDQNSDDWSESSSEDTEFNKEIHLLEEMTADKKRRVKQKREEKDRKRKELLEILKRSQNNLVSSSSSDLEKDEEFLKEREKILKEKELALKKRDERRRLRKEKALKKLKDYKISETSTSESDTQEVLENLNKEKQNEEEMKKLIQQFIEFKKNMNQDLPQEEKDMKIQIFLEKLKQENKHLFDADGEESETEDQVITLTYETFLFCNLKPFDYESSVEEKNKNVQNNNSSERLSNTTGMKIRKVENTTEKKAQGKYTRVYTQAELNKLRFMTNRDKKKHMDYGDASRFDDPDNIEGDLNRDILLAGKINFKGK